MSQECVSDSESRHSWPRDSPECASTDDTPIPIGNQLQLRAVSYHSLSVPAHSAIDEPTIDDASSSSGQVGVLQKVQKTLSNLKGKPSVSVERGSRNEIIISTGGPKSHRFGSLVWRSSKERLKSKTQRHNKCNSGDSGIHVESEMEEQLRNKDSTDQNLSEVRNVNIRRANSTSANRNRPDSQLPEKERIQQPSTMIGAASGRSLSQPSDLNRISHGDDDNTDNESDSDSDEETARVLAEVIFPFQAGGPEELTLPKGAVVEVLKQDAGPWWWGQTTSEVDHRAGWFPKDFVQLLDRSGGSSPLPPHSLESAIAAGENSVCSRATLENVIKELLETEINFVKLLASLCTGFLATLRNCPDVFATSSLDLIFSNVEEIYQFQQSFLEALRTGIKTERIAQAFLDHQASFMVYSNYCNAYARALSELEKYGQSQEALLVLESCRKRERLPELPLQAHLLAPIQRICKYPLHLIELVKHSPGRTATGDPDSDCKETFEAALSAMRRVTEMVNEGKRNSEYLACIQQKFENFKGPPLNVHSTRLFLQIDAIRMSPNNLWNNTYALFLLDSQLLMAKRDLLKRNHVIFKSRIFLDCCRILNLPNGKIFGVTLKNALRVYCDVRGKWYDFCFRTLGHKIRFLNMLAVERQFSGKRLFLAEFSDSVEDDDELADGQTMVVNYNNGVCESVAENVGDPESIERRLEGSSLAMKPPPNYKKLNKKYNSETLPKKSKRQQALNRETTFDKAAEYDSTSLGRRRIGNWFRKVKSTSNSPTPAEETSMSTISLVSHSSAETTSFVSQCMEKGGDIS